jgi:uracil-DNA glycosylase
MNRVLDPQTRRALADRLQYYRELGIYDFYRREAVSSDATVSQAAAVSAVLVHNPESREEMTPRKTAVAVVSAGVDEGLFDAASKPELRAGDPMQALKIIREDLGDCTRCKLHKQGRKQIVFGVGNPRAELMFVGEGPGADEDAQGEPFVGRAGQLLTKIIEAIGLKREDVYIANVIKCRPPQNRNPEQDEVETCEPFLFRQIDVIKPKVIVALGTFAARALLRTLDPISRLRGRVYDYRGAKLIPTFHPAYLLRNPASKREVWEDMKHVRALLRS